LSTKTVRQAVASAAGRLRNFLRAGNDANRSRSVAVVPLEPRHAVMDVRPPGSDSSRHASSSRVALTSSSSATAAMDDRASPRKPSVARDNRSSSSLILDVAWGSMDRARSSLPMPEPSSTTRRLSAPPPSSSTTMLLAPESSALSRSSLRAAAGLSMTSPAAIRLATSGASTRIRDASIQTVYTGPGFVSPAERAVEEPRGC